MGGEVLMQPSYLWTTVGYVIWPAAAKKFIELLPMDMPVDNFMAWHVKENNVKGLSVQPACVRQANTWNIGSDVAHSDDWRCGTIRPTRTSKHFAKRRNTRVTRGNLRRNHALGICRGTNAQMRFLFKVMTSTQT